jgi:thiol-disulfide isomerase/thioredoxin
MPHPASLIGLSVVLAGLASIPARPTNAATLVGLAQGQFGAVIAASTSRPLVKQLQGKPVVVDIYASFCPACRNIAPTLSKLRRDYANRVHFVVLDVSDKAKAEASQATAERLGLASFFAANRTQTGLVAIMDPATGKILVQHRNNADVKAYTSVLNRSLVK